MPEKEVLFMENLSCDNGIQSSWDYKAWQVNIENISLKNSTCTISFLSPKNFAEYIEYKRYQDDSIEEFSHSATYQTPALTDYRYTGANPDNYVCFGSEASPCPENNIYRIIGVIPTQSSNNSSYEKRVKLIKNKEYIGPGAESGADHTTSKMGYRWNKSSTNKWEESSLKNELNTNYWNSLGSYQNYIEPTLWYLGAPNTNYYNKYTAVDFYNLERSNTKGYSQGALSYVGNIGLMYPSDYGYSLGIEYKDESLYNLREKYLERWLTFKNGNVYEWTISPEQTFYYDITNSASAWHIHLAGYLIRGVTNYSYDAFNVRPTFYLKEDVQYKNGNGSKADPYYLSI